jgi:hypothetical protein
MAVQTVEFLNEGVYFPDEPDRTFKAKDIFDTFNFWDSYFPENRDRSIINRKK